MYVYLIRNKTNGKCYVGQTIQEVDRRLSSHRYNSMKPSAHGCPLLSLAIKKYGWDGFTRHVLEVCSSQEELDAAERHWIAHYECIAPRGYNIEQGGYGGRLLSEHTKAKISAANAGRRRSREYCEAAAIRHKAHWESAPAHLREQVRQMGLAHAAEACGHAKLTWEKVREIRALYDAGEGIRPLARRFGMSKNAISKIVHRLSWRVDPAEFTTEQ